MDTFVSEHPVARRATIHLGLERRITLELRAANRRPVIDKPLPGETDDEWLKRVHADIDAIRARIDRWHETPLTFVNEGSTR